MIEWGKIDSVGELFSKKGVHLRDAIPEPSLILKIQLTPQEELFSGKEPH